jgi:hypothetical protein
VKGVNPDDRAQPLRRRPNWTRIGVIAGIVAFVVVIAAISVGREACSHKQFPMICLAMLPFR